MSSQKKQLINYSKLAKNWLAKFKAKNKNVSKKEFNKYLYK